MSETSPNAFFNGKSLSSGSNVKAKLRAPEDMDIDNVGIAANRASTNYDVDVIWCDSQFNEIITENVASNVSSGTNNTSSTSARSRYCKVKISDAGSGSGAVDMTATYE